MDQIKIRVFVALENALTEGRTEYGDGLYAPSAEELAAMGADERAQLVPYIERRPGEQGRRLR